MATSRYGSGLVLLAAALALVLFVGTADAWGCPKGFKDCDPKKPGCETCIANDVNNCGDCGKKCPEKSGAYVSCDNGYCKYKCKPDYADCDNKWYNGCEVNIANDPYNCGKCGYACKQVANAVTKCNGGKCGPPVCNSGYGDCDGNKYNGCETNLNNDIYNCGKCGNKCPCTLKFGEPTCSSGKCGQQCKKGWKYDNVKKCCVQGY